MIETLKAIKEAAEKLSGMDFESIRTAYNDGALARWEAARGEARPSYRGQGRAAQGLRIYEHSGRGVEHSGPDREP